jgi:outer membrane protein W
MKTVTLLLFILITAKLFAQSQKINHLEIGASALFWTPTAEHMRATNTLIRAQSETTYIGPIPNLQGYGSCIAPSFHLKYYFKNFLGISFGFNYLSLINDLEYYESSTQTSGVFHTFHNEAQIYNLKLGYAGQSRDYTLIHLYYGIGLNYTPYLLEQNTVPNFMEQLPYSAQDYAFGLYINSGMQIKLFKFTYLNLGMEYTYIPKTIHYKAISKYEHEVKTNLGGIAGQVGIAVKFLNY